MPSLDQEIIEEIGISSDGLTIGELLASHPAWKRRTLSRHLANLVESQQLKATGDGPNRRYTVTFGETDRIIRSPASREIVNYVNRPIHQREPVGYQAQFLTEYQPNSTHYLRETHRRQLHRIGSTGNSDQPAGTYGRAVIGRLLIDLSWSSSHLEGNTYTRLDTVNLIEAGKAATGKAATETQMILNHKNAIELLIDQADTTGFNRYTITNVHGALSENLLGSSSDEGRLRQSAVDIAGSVYRPIGVPQQIEQYFDLFLQKSSQIADPFEQSFFALVHIPYLQPFADANKRTARLTCNIPMFKANLCPLTFKDVPIDEYSDAVLGVYELTRIDALRELYMWAYERSTREFLAIKREIGTPDQMRLQYGPVIKQVVAKVIRALDADPLTVISTEVHQLVPSEDREAIESAVNDELGHIHQGILARYGLRPSELENWRKRFN